MFRVLKYDTLPGICSGQPLLVVESWAGAGDKGEYQGEEEDEEEKGGIQVDPQGLVAQVRHMGGRVVR